MNLSEAAQVIAELRPRLAVPMHYGMFAENTADPEEFSRACAARGQPTVILECGPTVDTRTLLSSVRHVSPSLSTL